MKCFYHNDLDGRCSASIVSKEAHDCEKSNFIEIDYVTDIPVHLVADKEIVYFVDYSFTEPTIGYLQNLLDRGCRVIWIDHHASSLKTIENHPFLAGIEGIRTSNYSGAALTYMFFHGCEYQDIPYYVKLVDDYDRWVYSFEPDTKRFKLGIESRDCHPISMTWLLLASGKGLSKILQEGEIVDSYITNEHKEYCDSFSYEAEIAGHTALVVNRKSNSFIFGNRYKDYDLVCTWAYTGKKYVYSIFSANKNVDCSKIAESYGGGGHKGAAGFTSIERVF